MGKQRTIDDMRNFRLNDCFIRGKFKGEAISFTGSNESEKLIYEKIGYITLNFSIFEKIVMEKNLLNGYSEEEMKKIWEDDKLFDEYQKSRFSSERLFTKIESLSISDEKKDIFHQLRLERNDLSHSLVTNMPYLHMMNIEKTIENLELYCAYIGTCNDFCAALRDDVSIIKIADNVEKIMCDFILNPQNSGHEVLTIKKQIYEGRKKIIDSGVDFDFW